MDQNWLLCCWAQDFESFERDYLIFGNFLGEMRWIDLDDSGNGENLKFDCCQPFVYDTIPRLIKFCTIPESI